MWILVGVLGFVVAVGVIHVWLGWLHASLREELADADVLLAIEGVKASVSARATLSASATSLTGDLLVTDRAVVLFPRSRGIPIHQPPFVLVRARREDAVRKRWGVTKVVAGEGPRLERSITSVRRVAMHSAGAPRWTLRVETEDVESLIAALREFMDEERHGAPYRARQPDTTLSDTRVASPFVEGFLHRDPEVGFRRSPFTERIGHRDGIVCFEPDAADEDLWEMASADVDALGALPLGNCYYGAASYDVEPLLVGDPGEGELTGARVLEALRAKSFQSEHLRDLARTEIASPGYQPYSLNDEVHTDGAGQCLFYRTGYDEEQDEELQGDPIARQEAMDTVAVHEALQSLVDGPLWYVLLHEGGGEACPLVALFALGRSQRGRHLIGVASQQVCHNLCD